MPGAQNRVDALFGREHVSIGPAYGLSSFRAPALSVTELMELLDDYRSGDVSSHSTSGAASDHPTPAAPRRRLPIALAGIAITATGALVWWGFARDDPRPTDAQAVVTRTQAALGKVSGLVVHTHESSSDGSSLDSWEDAAARRVRSDSRRDGALRLIMLNESGPHAIRLTTLDYTAKTWSMASVPLPPRMDPPFESSSPRRHAGS